MTIQESLNKIQLFLPVSIPIMMWYVFVIIYMVVDLILTIIVHCFDHVQSKTVLFQVINNILPIIQILDICISLNTGFIKNGKIILNRKAANRQYFMTIYFYCDIIALIFSLLQIVFQNTILKGISVFNYIIFIKLTTAYYTDSLFKKYIIKSFNYLILYQVFKNFIILALLSHIIGSFYFYIDVIMHKEKWYPQSQLWIFNSYAMLNIYTQDFWVQYTYSYYVACVTLSGTAYGDIVPLNPYENLYIFCCFVFPMLIYSYVYSSIFTALFNRRSVSAQIRRYKFLAKQYLKSLGVNSKVMDKILAYLEFIYRKNLVVDTKFLQDLAPTIKQEYLQIMTKDKFNFTCFKPLLSISNLDQSYLKSHIVNLIHQQFFPERIALLTIQKLRIYYVNTGKVVEVVQLSQKKKLSKPIQRESHVAKIAFFTNQIPIEKLSYQTNSFVICHSIDYKQLKNKMRQKMPTINEAFCLIQNKILDEKQYQTMNQMCYFCDETSHTLQQCPKLSLDKVKMFQEKYHYKQQRKSFNRDYMVKRPRIIKKQSMFVKLGNSQQLQNKNYRSKKIYTSSSTKIQNEIFNLFLDEQFYRYLAQFNIKQKHYQQQTSGQDISFQMKNSKMTDAQRGSIQKVAYWDRYYPQWNI